MPQAMAIDAGGEGQCIVKLKVDDQAQEGLMTVVAGLYQGDRMVSSDYAARPICCKVKKSK